MFFWTRSNIFRSLIFLTMEISIINGNSSGFDSAVHRLDRQKDQAEILDKRGQLPAAWDEAQGEQQSSGAGGNGALAAGSPRCVTHTERPRVTYKANEARNPRVRSFVRSRVRVRALPLISYLPISPFGRCLIRGRRSPHDRLLFPSRPPPPACSPVSPRVPLSDSRLASSTHVARSLCPLPSPRVISHSLACTSAIVYACASDDDELSWQVRSATSCVRALEPRMRTCWCVLVRHMRPPRPARSPSPSSTCLTACLLACLSARVHTSVRACVRACMRAFGQSRARGSRRLHR